MYHITLHIDCDIKDTTGLIDEKLSFKASEVPKQLISNLPMGKSITKLVISFLYEFEKHHVHSTIQY